MTENFERGSLPLFQLDLMPDTVPAESIITVELSRMTTHGLMNSSVIHVAPIQGEAQNIVLITKIVPDEMVATRSKTRATLPNWQSLTVIPIVP
tara:strand:+ start:370032 stop:370313 length:282 start_codon:yes stop_codon:yes gene_type:complete